MVAPRKFRKIVCTVVRVQENTEANIPQHCIGAQRLATRPSDLLPWADPYIAKLVRNLQMEVRQELTQASQPSIENVNQVAEMEPPCPSIEPEWPWNDDRRITQLHPE